MKLALVHDYLNQYGGAEKCVEAFCEMFPNSPLYTSIYDSQKMPDVINNHKIITSFMQKLPFWKNHFKKYLPLYPMAFESFDLSEYDVVLSSSSAWGKGGITSPDACHICYCYSPMRFVWRFHDYIKSEKIGTMLKIFLPVIINRLRSWDYVTAQQVDYFVAISEAVKKRIHKFYNKDAIVIYPPVETNKYNISNTQDNYFLIVSRLNAYKKLDIPIEASNRMGFTLKIAGDGPYKKNLMQVSGKNIEFLGRVSDQELLQLYSKCKALIFPGEEDFGITPVEAQASGRPVIAFGKGGALETVIENETGVFFYEPTVDSLIDAINRFEKMTFDPQKCIENARRFDVSIFKEKMMNFVGEKWENTRKEFSHRSHRVRNNL